MTTKSERRVGIVMRTLDRPIFVKRAIDAIRNQTFPHWHIYIVNNGGDAAALQAVLAPYGDALTGKLTLTNIPITANRGQSLSLGIDLVSEEYMMIHDDDDTLEPEFLEKTIRFLDHDQRQVFVGVTTSNYDVFEYVENEEIIVKEKTDKFGLKGGSIVDFGMYLSRAIVILPITFIFRRKAIDERGNVDTNLRSYEDVDLFLRVMMSGEIGIINEFLCSYHQRAKTGTSYDQYKAEYDYDVSKIYKNNTVRDAINGKGGLKNIKAMLESIKTLEDIKTQQILNEMAKMTKVMEQTLIAFTKIINKG